MNDMSVLHPTMPTMRRESVESVLAQCADPECHCYALRAECRRLSENYERMRVINRELQRRVEQLESEIDKKMRKSSTSSRYWTQDEHERFLKAVEIYGKKDVKSISAYVNTRTETQVRSHAQKYFLKLEGVRTGHGSRSQSPTSLADLGSSSSSVTSQDPPRISLAASSPSLPSLHRSSAAAPTAPRPRTSLANRLISASDDAVNTRKKRSRTSASAMNSSSSLSSSNPSLDTLSFSEDPDFAHAHHASHSNPNPNPSPSHNPTHNPSHNPSAGASPNPSMLDAAHHPGAEHAANSAQMHFFPPPFRGPASSSPSPPNHPPLLSYFPSFRALSLAAQNDKRPKVTALLRNFFSSDMHVAALWEFVGSLDGVAPSDVSVRNVAEMVVQCMGGVEEEVEKVLMEVAMRPNDGQGMEVFEYATDMMDGGEEFFADEVYGAGRYLPSPGISRDFAGISIDDNSDSFLP